MSTNRPLRVFICHSSNDKPVVRELYQQLNTEPWIQPWLDEEELYPGADWNLEIEKAVESSDAILVCLTKNSITKEGYIQRELRIILDLADYKPEGTLFIIPVRLEDCEPPRRLRSWQYADYFAGQRERAFQRLLFSLRNRAKTLDLSFITPSQEIKESQPFEKRSLATSPESHHQGFAIEGSIWDATESDGNNLVFRFLTGGILDYTSPTGTFTHGTWKQRGNSIYFEMNKKFAEYEGTIDSDLMTGNAWNQNGEEWTWTARRQ